MKKLQRRGWLRKIGEGGDETSFHSSCIPRTYTHTNKKGEKIVYKTIDASFKLRDCSRSVGLDLYSDDKKQSLHNLKALDNLIDEALILREAMEEAINDLFEEGK